MFLRIFGGLEHPQIFLWEPLLLFSPKTLSIIFAYPPCLPGVLSLSAHNRWAASSPFLGPELLTSPGSSERNLSSLVQAACDEGSCGRNSGITGDLHSHSAGKQPCARELASLNALPSPQLPSTAFRLLSSEIYDDWHVACFVLMGGRGESGVFDDIWVLYLIGRPVRSRKGQQGEARKKEETQRRDRKRAEEQNDAERKDYRSKRQTEEDCRLTSVTFGQYEDDPSKVDQGEGQKMEERKGHPIPEMEPSVVRKKDASVAPSVLDSECFSTVWRRCGQLPSPLCCHNAHVRTINSFCAEISHCMQGSRAETVRVVWRSVECV